MERADPSNANTASRTGQQIGIRSFITPKVEAWASAGNGRVSANANTTYTVTSTNPTVNFTAYQLGSNYWLSKRTNLYAIFGSNHTSSSSTTLSEGATQYAVGVRHTF